MFRKLSFVPDCYYHIYNRGTDKIKLFFDEKDYLRFTVLLYVCNSVDSVRLECFLPQGRSLRDILKEKRDKELVYIGAYCLMPNHFHLLIKEKIEGGITAFMKKVGTAYAMYMNKKNKRSGNLFQGRFKAELVDKDEYLKYLFAYIHLNPIKLIEPQWKEKGIKNIGQAKKFLNDYQWSSFPTFIGKRKNDFILNREEFPEYFDDIKEFLKFIREWLEYNK
jgi:putative transposase